LVKDKKKQLAAAQYESDEFDGLIHSAESALDIRCAIRRAQAELAISKKGINFGAKVQQCAILRAAGVPLIRKTEKSGLPKIDKEVLEGLGRHQAAKAMLQYILTEKTINVYIEGEKRAGKGGGRARPVMVTEDGYIHPEWAIHKITGRWGSSPNCQNWSVRAGGGAENLRSMIEAPDGYRLISADEKQLEARLIAAMSGCKYMLDTFARGDDIHGAFAAIGFPNDWLRLHGAYLDHKKVGKCKCHDCLERGKMRDVTKRLEYGFFYGGKEQTLFESIVKDFPDSTLGQVRDFMNRLNSMLPEVLTWRDETLAAAIKDCAICSPILGRLQVFPLGRVDPNVAYNFKCQSGGADIWLIGAQRFMQRWNQNEFDARLIQNGHDSVLVLVREELAEQVEKDVCECWSMEWSGVQFEMESKIVKRWSGD
jgi:DNA polymerase I-like protein with 3'-5' exonuclease and polymerase domains